MYSIVRECVQGSGLTARAPTRRVACACTSAADLQANASAADLSETRCFDAWGLQASSLEGLLGSLEALLAQKVLGLTAGAGCPIQTSARGLLGLQASSLEAWRGMGSDDWVIR